MSKAKPMTPAARHGNYLPGEMTPRQRRRDLHKRHRMSGYDGAPLAHARPGKGTATPRQARHG